MIITQTPLRIGLVGGGTDLPQFYREHGGRVLSCAIDKYVYVIVKERFDADIYVNYSRKEIVGKVDELEHELVREAMKMAEVDKAVEITMLADIPSSGSGLGSSSAVTVGLLNALLAYRGRQVTGEDLAEMACEIEIGRCGKRIGKQDQYLAALGGLRDLRFGPGEQVVAEQITLPNSDLRSFQSQLMLFFTGITRLAEPILREQADNVATTSPQLLRLAVLAGEAVNNISHGDIDGLASAMRTSWEMKRTLASGITNREIDDAVSLALDAGATGAKITGAGGGGFLLLICPLDHQACVRERLSHMRELPIRLDRLGSRIVLNMMRDIWS